MERNRSYKKAGLFSFKEDKNQTENNKEIKNTKKTEDDLNEIKNLKLILKNKK